jgi:2'-5' RNA ligase
MSRKLCFIKTALINNLRQGRRKQFQNEQARLNPDTKTVNLHCTLAYKKQEAPGLEKKLN